MSWFYFGYFVLEREAKLQTSGRKHQALFS